MIISYLLILCIASAVALLTIWLLNPKFGGAYTLVSFMLFVSCLGHLMIGLSTNLDEVIVANKLNYAGSIFTPLFLFYAVTDVCKIKVSRILSFLLGLYTFIVCALSMTVGFSGVYYRSIEYVQTYEGVGNYSAVYGWGHALFNILIFGIFITNLCLVVYSFARKKNVSFKNLVALAMIYGVTIFSFIASRFWNCDTLIMPAVYVFDQIALTYICFRVQSYDIGHNVLSVLKKNNTDGYVLTSSKNIFLGCNDIAYELIPELKKCRVDHALLTGVPAIDFLKNWIREVRSGKHGYSKPFSVGDSHYKVSVKRVPLLGGGYGNLFKFVDDTELHNYVQMLGDSNSHLKTIVRSNANQLKSIQEQMIIGMANLVESRDSNTGGHIKRTSSVISILVDELRREKNEHSEEFFKTLVSVAPMHDLGKIAINDEILRKPGKFTPDEYAAMKTHAEKGAVIVENLLSPIENPEFVSIAKNVAWFHHERFDGNGYPKGLKGLNIPFEARVMAIADVYDALVSKRCYKEKYSFEDAFDIIANGMGTQFDPSLWKCFYNSRKKLEEYYKTSV